MLTIIVILFAVLAVAFLAFVASTPGTMRVARSTSIAAPPERIFALINDFHNWAQWSPYERLDTAMQRSYSGAASGGGAVYEWDDNKKVGKGQLEMLDTMPPGRLTIKLDFFKPFEGHNVAEFTIVPNGSASDATWAMHGPSAFMMKLVGTVMNMDKMIGDQFAEGLANLKRVAES